MLTLIQDFLIKENIRKGFYHIASGNFMIIASDPDAAQLVLRHPKIYKKT